MSTPPGIPVYTKPPVRSYFSELWRRREFIWFLSTGNFKARNASTSLGLLWWVIDPILLGSIYYLVFGVIFEIRGPGYIGYLMCGMFTFHYTGQALRGIAGTIVLNARLIANLQFPRLILPIAMLIEVTFGFLASLLVLMGVVFVLDGITPGPQVALVLLMLPIHFLFNLGIGAIAARLAVPFRDVSNLIPFLVRIWMYLSPIIWPLERLDRLAPPIEAIIRINPMYSFLSVYRSAMLGNPIEWGAFAIAGAWAVGVAVVGVVAFTRYEGHMVRYL